MYPGKSLGIEGLGADGHDSPVESSLLLRNHSPTLEDGPPLGREYRGLVLPRHRSDSLGYPVPLSVDNALLLGCAPVELAACLGILLNCKLFIMLHQLLLLFD